jgi:hypothetical protein
LHDRQLTVDKNVRQRWAFAKMDKRARFIAELRREAQKRNLAFREEKSRGKGGHSMVWSATTE